MFFLFLMLVFGVREAFHWIRSAILIHPEVVRPREHFSGPVLDYFFDLLDDFTSLTMGGPPSGGSFFFEKMHLLDFTNISTGCPPSGGSFF